MHILGVTNLKTYEDGNSKKWVLGNGIGGYAAQSVINSQYRKHDGYLIASLKAPVERYMILNTITEEVVLNNKTIDLTNGYINDRLVNNYKYLRKFKYDIIPSYDYFVEGVSYSKTISLEYKKNTVAVKYNIKSNKDATLNLIPHFNYREHGEASSKENLSFKVTNKKNLTTLFVNDNVSIKFYYSNGKIIDNQNKIFGPVRLIYDELTGDDRVDYHYTPVKLSLDIKENEEISLDIVVTIEDKVNKNVDKVIKDNYNRLKKISKLAKTNDELFEKLVIAGDVFISDRKSTNLTTILAGLPWFTDWGRDTMIAYTGLLLVPHRFTEAKEVLISFSKYEKDGLIPNMFPDDNNAPLYNTVDASLWYFYACYKYYEYTKDLETIKSLLPTLKSILDNYQKGTLFNIKMNEDGLISAGSGFDQVTWMDVFANGKVMTPRHGKPVEINALWYNALCSYQYFNELLNNKKDSYIEDLIKKVKESFNNRFYNEDKKCLYDVVDELESGHNDDKVRPNQLYAVSLPFKVLNKCYMKNVVDTCHDLLYNLYGMRSLAQNEPGYIGTYDGPLHIRDEAYHMGTTWGFIIGTFIDSHYYVYKDKKMVKIFIDNFIPHLSEGCLDGVCEVMNGDVPLHTRGCYTQAWSVGELLRAYYENYLKKED